MEIILMLIVGVLAGGLASKIFVGRSIGLYGNIIIGLLGSAFGYWVFGEFSINFAAGMFNTILTGATGAIVILLIVNLFFPGRKNET